MPDDAAGTGALGQQQAPLTPKAADDPTYRSAVLRLPGPQLLTNTVVFASGLAFLPTRVWSWRPLSTAVVLLQAALLFELCLFTRMV